MQLQIQIIHENGNTMHFIDSNNENENCINYNEVISIINDSEKMEKFKSNQSETLKDGRRLRAALMLPSIASSDKFNGKALIMKKHYYHLFRECFYTLHV